MYSPTPRCSLLSPMPIACRRCARPSPDCAHVRAILVVGGADRPEASPPELRLESLLQTAPRTALPQIAPEDIAVMLYSSGTTGRAKGVLLSHANLLASAAAVSDAAEPHIWEGPRDHGQRHAHRAHFRRGDDERSLMIPEHLADQTLLVQLRWFDPERFMARSSSIVQR